MAISYQNYTGNGSNRDFAVPFPYIAQAHVSVSVNGTGVPFVWISAGLIRTDTAPAGGSLVQVRRTTPTTPLTDFADGDGNYEAALDIAALQPLYVVQEVQDFVADAALGGVGAVASSIAFAPEGTITSTNVQAAILESMADLRAELAPLAAPQVTGGANALGTLMVGAGVPAGAVKFGVDNASASGQARFRHSGGLGFLINQSENSGRVVLMNQDNARLILGTNNTEVMEVLPDQTINLLGGPGKLTIGGHPSRAVVVSPAITVGTGDWAYSHGGSRRPDIFQLAIRCQTAEWGYSVGDTIDMGSYEYSNNHALTSWASDTQVGVRNNGAPGAFIVIAPKGGGSPQNITTGRWIFVWTCIWL